jgi:hypothetical protein
MIIENKVSEVIKLTQKLEFKLPFDAFEITARIINTAVSVRIVPPTVIATEDCLDRPSLEIIG